MEKEWKDELSVEQCKEINDNFRVLISTANGWIRHNNGDYEKCMYDTIMAHLEYIYNTLNDCAGNMNGLENPFKQKGIELYE